MSSNIYYFSWPSLYLLCSSLNRTFLFRFLLMLVIRFGPTSTVPIYDFFICFTISTNFIYSQNSLIRFIHFSRKPTPFPPDSLHLVSTMVFQFQTAEKLKFLPELLMKMQLCSFSFSKWLCWRNKSCIFIASWKSFSFHRTDFLYAAYISFRN